MTDEPLLEVNDQIWEKTVKKGTQPVAVMFYSPVCPFCQQIEPYFKSYAEEFRNSVLFTRINIMANPWTAERYGIRSTPTFKFFCYGKAVQEIVGPVYPALLKKMVEEGLALKKECEKNTTANDYEITGYG